MTTRKSSQDRSNRRNEAVDAAGGSRTSRAAEAELGKSSERTKKATSRIFLALRIVLFVLACVFAVVVVKGFIDATDQQSVSRTVTTESVRAEASVHALVLFSYDESDASVSYERDSVLGVLGRSGVSYDVFYLDARSNADNKKADKRLYDSILEKATEAGGYDIVITAGDEALSYVMDNEDLFGGIPASFFAVDDERLATSAQSGGIASGYYEEGAAALSLDTAAKLMPNAREVVVLVDGSAEAEGMLTQLESERDVAQNVLRDVWDVSKMSRDDLAGDLSALGNDAFVMLLAANRDEDGGVYSPSETAYFVSGNTKAPVFSALGGVGEGVCGSAFIDRQTEGVNAVKLAVDMLNGKKASELPVLTVNPDCCVFDAQALEAHGVNPDSTPENASIINESAFSWRVLRPILRPVLFIIIAIVCIVGFGVIGFRRSMQSNRALIESRNDLQYRLYHDLLTDLPNRYALDQLVNDPVKGKAVKSMMQVDIDDFTDINDSYGHAFGDEIIQVIAKRMRNVKSTMLLRSGGDEFTLAFDHKLEPDCAELRHIGRIFNDPVIIGDSKLDLSATVGVANSDENVSGEDLIVCSDLAIHNAKENNYHHPVFYSDDMREGMEHKLEITAYLKQAIADENINVVWQPQVETDTLKVYGYEALCRLEGNAYYPGEFIPVAEMSGLVVPIGRIVTKKVVAQLGAWLKEGREVGIASINYSAAQLRDKEYCNFLAEQLAIYGVPASLIKIEITESMILGNEDDAERLFTRLRSMGVTLALDDFGTGYSSLYRMAKRPMDIVKLDKSLVDTFMVPGKEGFIDDITQLIHGLGKTIVVEGVETLEQYMMCLDFGCDIIQGYFFSRPVSAEEANTLDPSKVLAEARAASGDKTRNGDWHKYDRDEHGRWKKKDK